MEKKINSFTSFYPYYLKEHQHKWCRIFHFIGTTMVLALPITALYHSNPSLLYLIPVVGYGFAWAGHLFFEKNKPATFKYPLWSLRADFKMYFEILSGKISIDESKNS